MDTKLFGLDAITKRVELAVTAGEAVLLYGPAGSGKTIMAKQLAEKYSKSANVPVVYQQLYPEMTKGTLIGGETLKNGSIVVEPQIIVTAGVKGAVFVIDECTHTTDPVLLSFNSLIEEPNSTMIGDKEFKMDARTRFIFCGNYPDHIGNIPLPTSFANRLYIEDIGHVAIDDYIKIAMHYTKIDAVIAKFIAGIIERTRDESMPVSPRNMLACSRAICRLANTGYTELPKTVRETADLKKVMQVLKDSNISPDAFKEVVLSTLGARIKAHSTVPDKIRALLW